MKKSYVLLLIISLMSMKIYAKSSKEATSNVLLPLSGSYTIGGTSPDFATIADAFNELSSMGVDGPTFFEIRDGSYIEQLSLGIVPGASVMNTITFRSESQDSSMVVISYNSPSNSNYVLSLNNTDYITFEHMTFESVNVNYGRVITLIDTVENLTIQHCAFKAIDANDYHIYGNDIENFNTTIRNCVFEGNGYGIHLDGTTNGNNYFTGLIIDNNQFINQTTRAIYTRYQRNFQCTNNMSTSSSSSGTSKFDFDDCYDGILISNNVIDWKNGGAGMRIQAYRTAAGLGDVVVNRNTIKINSNYGMHIDGAASVNGGMRFTDNIITVFNGNYGIQYYYDGVSTKRSLFANNYFHVGGSNNKYAFYGSSFFYTDIFHNSFNVTSTGGNTYCYWESCGRFTDMVNNIFNIDGNGYSLFVTNCYGDVFNRIDYNSYYSDDGLFHYRGNQYTSLESYQNAWPIDSNSIFEAPFFLSDTSYQIAQIAINNKGIYLDSVTTDIEGDARDLVMPDIGADEFDPPLADAGIIMVDAPNAPFSIGSQPVKAVLKNFGADPLTSADIEWEVNGTAQSGVNWTGSLASGDTAIVEIGSIIFEIDTGYDIKAWSTGPNGGVDPFAINDTTTNLNLYAGLDGQYTLGGLSPDFENFTTLKNQLNFGGVLGPVQIDVRDGTYTEQFILRSFPGSDSSRMVTIQSESLDSSLVTVNYSSPSNSNYVMTLSATDNITFKHITFQSLSTSYGRVVTLGGNLQNISFENCHFKATDSNDYHIYGTSIINKNTAIRNCQFDGNGYAIHLSASTNGGNYNPGLVIDNNSFQNQSTRILYTIYQLSPKFTNNQISSNSTSGTIKVQIGNSYDAVEVSDNHMEWPNGGSAYYIQSFRTASGSGNFIVKGNRTHIKSGYGIYVDGNSNSNGTLHFTENIFNVDNGQYGIQYSFDGIATNRALFANNYFHVGGTLTRYGFYGSSFFYTNIYNNSINITNTAGTSYGYWESCGRYTELVNNAIYVQGSGYSVYVTNCYNEVFSRSDYNSFYSPGGDMFYRTNNHLNLNAYQQATNLDSNSIYSIPFFINDSSYQIGQVALHDAGTTLPEITTDIEGDLRDTLPDIGADEFDLLPTDAGIMAIVLPEIPFPIGSHLVKAVLKNFGSDPLTSADIEWKINGVLQTTVNWSGSIQSGDTTIVELGMATIDLAQGYQIDAWSILPNGISDVLPVNDSIDIQNVYAGVSGVYTLGGVSPDFIDFAILQNQLNYGGVLSDAQIEVRDGVYNEQITLRNFPGSSMGNTVSIYGENGDSSLVTLTYDSPSNAQWTLRLINTRNLTLQDLTLASLDANYGRVLTLIDTVENLTVQNCAFQSIDLYDFFIYGTNIENLNTTIQNCYFKGNGYGVFLQGSTNGNNYNPGTLIENNLFENQNYYGLYTRYQRDIKVNQNIYTSTSTASNHKFQLQNSYDQVEFKNNQVMVPNGSDGIYISGSQSAGGVGDVIVEDNIVHIKSGAGITLDGSGSANGTLKFSSNRVNILNATSNAYGVQLYYDANVNNRSLCANNFIQIGGSSTKYGIYAYFHSYTNMFHNSISLTPSSGTNYAYYDYGGQHVNMLNNILNVQGNGFAFYVVNYYSNVFAQEDYNDFHNTSGNLIYYRGTTHADLASYQSTSTLDSNSVSIDPLFLNDTFDLHVTNVLLDKLGTPVPEVTIDIDGDTRDPIRPDIGADEFITAANDVSIIRLDSPKMLFPAGNSQITVSVLNNGLDTLKDFTIQWSINGEPQLAFDWTGEVPSGNSIDSLAIGSYQFEIDSNYSITFITENPNGQADGFPLDDTLRINNLYAALGGTYTIGGINPDFDSFGRAITALKNGGVIDSVTFNVRDGLYHERLIIPSINGASADRTITFQSETGNAENVELKFVTSNADSTFVIVLDNADYFNFKNIRINSTGSVYARVINIKNNALYNEFIGNEIVSNIINTTNNNHDLVIINSNQQNHGNAFIDNKFSGGAVAIFYPSSTSYTNDVRIIGNTFENQYQLGFYSSYLRNLTISQNTFENTSGYTNYYAMEPVASGQNLKIDGNRIIVQNGGYGIFITSYNDEGTLAPAIVSNNFIICNGTSAVSGIRINSSDYVKVLHNTIRINNTSTSSNAMSIASGIEHYVYNNICANFGAGQTINAGNNYLTGCDYNNLFSNGTILATYGSAYSNLTNWQTSTGFGAHSISRDPLFENDSSFVVFEIELNNTGTPLEEVTKDIEGDSRDTNMPDIGADEFTPIIPDDISVIKIISPNKDVPFSGVDEEVVVVLRNNGSNIIQSAQIKSVIDGVNQFPYNWTGTLLPGERDTVMIGTTNLSFNTAHTIVSYSASPNGVMDNTPSNDTSKVDELYAGLIGIYTIGGVLPNFNTINEVTNILNNGGVLGAVELRLRNGTYHEQVLLNKVAGVSALNTVTFTSESGDPGLVTIEYNGTSSFPFTIRLNNSDHIIFEKMTLQSLNTNYGSVMYIQNSATSNLLRDNIIQANSGTNDALIYSPSSSNDHENIFLSNTFLKGGRAIDLRGINSVNQQIGIRIEDNIFIDQNYESIYLDDHRGARILRNKFDFLNRNVNNISINLYDCDGALVLEQNVINRPNGTGIQMQYCNALNSLETGRIVNNTIALGGTGNVNGLYMNSCSLLEVLHNSIHLSNTNPSSKAYYDRSNSNNTLINNIFSNSGGGYAVYTTGAGPVESDFNDYYANGANLGYWVNTNVPDLPALQAASGKDANSLSVNPLFFSDENLHVLQIALDGTAQIIPEITEDFEGDPRDMMSPDIGADEFDFITDDIGVIEVTGPSNACELTATEQLTIVIQNYGGLAQTGFDVEIILNGETPIIENVGSAIVPPGDTIHYALTTPLDLSAYQIHSIETRTNLIGDLNGNNDASTYQLQNYQQPASPSNLLPGDGQMDVSKPIQLSWLPSVGATLYDLFIWADTLPKPATPYFANLTQISAVINTSSFVFGVAYSWQIVAKNPFCSSESQIQTFTLRELPDLISTNIQVPVGPFSSQTISVSWNVMNIGVGATLDETWYDQVYLSQDNSFSISFDTYLGAVANLAALAPDESYAHTMNVTLPQGISGTWYVFVIPNGYNNIPEGNTMNNPSGVPINISLTPPPDLKVTSVLPPNNAFSGTQILVNYTVTNEGAGDTEESSWRDYIYISDSEMFNLNNAIYLEQRQHSGQLMAGGSYIGSAQVEIPDEIFGEYFIHVFTDRQSQVYEFAFEDNNVGTSDTVQIFLTPPPDLELTSFILPDTLSPAQSVNAIYTVTNVGATSAVGDWRDRIYISAIDTFDASAVVLRTVNPANVLSAGFDYLSAGLITIPATYDGDYYIYFRTDYQNSIFEFNSEANNILGTGKIAIVPPDLQVQDITAPAAGFSGKPITIGWNILNDSRGKIFNKANIDSIYISTSPTFDGTAIAIDGLSYNVTLGQEGISARQKNVVLPNGISGTYYLHVKTDDTENIFEGVNEDNNVASTPINITLSPSPDLQIMGFSALDDTIVTIINEVPLQITVGNQGAANAVGSSWTDKLYLSIDTTWDANSPNNFLLKEQDRFQPLNAGENYALNFNITFPMVEDLVPGRDSFMFHLYAITDIDDHIYEHGVSNNNNVLKSQPIFLICPTETDLRVVNVSTAPDTLETSQKLTVEWTIDNIGTSTEIWGYDFWYNGIYLSNDSIWDENDLLIQDFTQEGPLDSLGIYSNEKTITIPEVPSGIYCLMLVADNKGYLDEESKTNNVKILPVSGPPTNIYIKQKTPSNLVAKTFTAPVDGISGQPIDVIIRVKNEGNGEVDQDWVDKVYLSTDFTISNSDNILFTKVNHPTLAPGEEYLDTVQAFIPINKEGNFILLFKTDANNRIFEMGQEGDNTLFTFITIDRDDPSDLVVTNATVPASIFVNQKIDIDYEIKNIGQFPAGGFQRDILYLSQDSIFDVGDVQLGIKQLTSQLAPNAIQNRTIEMVCTPGVPLGDYHVIIQTDALNNIYEVSDDNNVYISPGKINIQVEELPMNVLTNNNLIHQGSAFYRIEIPDSLINETMRITLGSDKPLASNEMYLSRNMMPTRSTHDYSHSIPFSPYQEVIVPELDSGTYYLYIYGETNISEPQEILVIAEIIEFSIRSIGENTAGNTGTMTARLTGAKFTENMIVSLHNDALGTHVASKLFFINSTEVFVSFNLVGAELGVYDVVVEKPGGDSIALEDGFTIVDGPVGSVDAFGSNENGFTCNIKNLGTENLLSSNIIAPNAVRVGRVVPITIQFGNNGTMDIPCPQRFILSVRGAPLGYNPDELSEMKQELLLVFEEPGGPPGILRPGATGSMTVYTFSSHPLRFYIQE